MARDYGLKTIDEIIESEAAQGNTHAVNYAREMFDSPDKLIKIFRLTDVENKFVLLQSMDAATRQEVLPLLEKDDLVMGLYFFNQDKLLEMLKEVDQEELIHVIQDAFPLQQIVLLIPEEDLAEFFKSSELDKYIIENELKSMPPEMTSRFIEGITGLPMEKVENPEGIIDGIVSLPDDKFKEFISQIDPEVQRQLVFQITKKDDKYLELFSSDVYINMLNTLMKNDMIPSMIALEKESLVDMVSRLPDDLMSIVASQVDTGEFAKFLIKGHTDLLEKAWMI